MKSIAFIYCIEAGNLEKETIMSITSLRRYGGAYSDSKIFCVCPRIKNKISKQSKQKLTELGVIYKEVDLNTEFNDYGLANKPLVCSFIESIEKKVDYLIFLDSDTIIINDLDNILNFTGKISCSPVLVGNIGVIPGTKDTIWSYCFDLFNISSNSKETTLITDEEILGYWNSGVIIIENGNGYFQEWEEIFSKAYYLETFPKNRLYFREQFSFSLICHKYNNHFKTLKNQYNYHISNHLELKDKASSYSEINILHYHRILKFAELTLPFPKLRKNDRERKVIKKLLGEFDFYPLPLNRMIYNTLGNKWFRLKSNFSK